MKIKHKHPRTLKPGDKLWLESLPREIAKDGAPRIYTVVKVMKKACGYFTGVPVWKVETSPPFCLPLQFHAKFRSLPVELAPVIVS